MKKLDKFKLALLYSDEICDVIDIIFELGDITIHPKVNTNSKLNPLFIIDKNLSIREDLLDENPTNIMVPFLLVTTMRRSLPKAGKLRQKVDLVNYWFAFVSDIELMKSKDLYQNFNVPTSSKFIEYFNNIKEAAEMYLELSNNEQLIDPDIKELYEKLDKIFNGQEKAKHVKNTLSNIPSNIMEDYAWIKIIDNLISDDEIDSYMKGNISGFLSHLINTFKPAYQVNVSESESLSDLLANRARDQLLKNRGTNKSSTTEEIIKKSQNIYMPLHRILDYIISSNITVRSIPRRYPFPAKGSVKTRDLINIVLDVSGSITTNELEIFLSIIEKINTYNPVRIIQMDVDINKVSLYTPGTFTRVKKFTIKGRGGTDFTILDEVQHKYKSSTWIFLTDGKTNYPEKLAGTKFIFMIDNNSLFGVNTTYKIPNDYIAYLIQRLDNKVMVRKFE